MGPIGVDAGRGTNLTSYARQGWRDKRRPSFGVTGGEVSFACVIYIRWVEILSSRAAGRADVST